MTAGLERFFLDIKDNLKFVLDPLTQPLSWLIDSALYAFTNRRRNKIKCLLWEDNGFILYYKALAEEKFRWPKAGEELLMLTGEQINWLLDGYDILQMRGHRQLHFESVN